MFIVILFGFLGGSEGMNDAESWRVGTTSRLLSCNRTWYISERESILIESPGFGGSAGYPRETSCIWRIYNNRCNLIMNCPKFRLSDLLCFDYMEIQNYYGWSRRHCGLQRPSDLNLGRFTTIAFISSTLFKFPLTGFRCRIQCEEKEKLEVTTTTSPTKVSPSNCTCGIGFTKRKSKIINGTAAFTTEFPWIVALVSNNDDNLPFCAGSLISNRYILTAAHCVQGSHSRFRVILNYDPEDVTILGSRSTQLQVERVIVHPKYNSLRLDFDAALIKLAHPFDLNESTYTVPVCLPELKDRLQNFTGENATVIGWGATSVSPVESGSRKGRVPLHKVNLSVLADRKCQEAYPDRRIKPEKLCAYSLFQDSCEVRRKDDVEEGEVGSSYGNVMMKGRFSQGDSGGPLMLPKKSPQDIASLFQIGIVSSGSGCAQVDTPGIYIRTSEILTWIGINTRDSSYCAR